MIEINLTVEVKAYIQTTPRNQLYISMVTVVSAYQHCIQKYLVIQHHIFLKGRVTSKPLNISGIQ